MPKSSTRAPSAWRRVVPLRGLSVLVFVSFAIASVGLAAATRRLVADQEQRLLKQRAGEAAALLTNLMGSVQTTVKALATVVQATNEDPAAYQRAAGGANPRGSLDVAMVKETGGRFRVVASKGAALGPETEFPPEVVGALRRARTSPDLVATSVFRVGDQRRVGFALRTGTTDDAALVYGESVLRGTTQQRPGHRHGSLQRDRGRPLRR